MSQAENSSGVEKQFTAEQLKNLELLGYRDPNVFNVLTSWAMIWRVPVFGIILTGVLLAAFITWPNLPEIIEHHFGKQSPTPGLMFLALVFLSAYGAAEQKFQKRNLEAKLKLGLAP